MSKTSIIIIAVYYFIITHILLFTSVHYLFIFTLLYLLFTVYILCGLLCIMNMFFLFMAAGQNNFTLRINKRLILFIINHASTIQYNKVFVSHILGFRLNKVAVSISSHQVL